MNLRNTQIFNGISRIGDRIGIAPERLEEFMKFAVVGGSGVIVNMGCLFAITRYGEMDIKFASPIAIEISILTNFFLNNLWTFRKRDTGISFLSRIFRYHLVTGLAGIVNYFTLLFLTNIFGVQDMISNLIGILLGTLINFFLNSLWTWRVKAETGDQEKQEEQ